MSENPVDSLIPSGAANVPPLAYQSRGSLGAHRLHWWLAAVSLACVSLSINGFLMFAALRDRSWGALAIAVYVGPVTNVVTLAIGIGLGLLLRRRFGESGRGVYTTTAIMLPLAAIPLNFFLVMLMNPHGC